MNDDSKNISAAKTTAPANDDLRPSYESKSLDGGTFGRFYGDYVKSKHIARLEPDVAQAFPNEESVNEALRTVMHAAERLRKLAEEEHKASA